MSFQLLHPSWLLLLLALPLVWFLPRGQKDRLHRLLRSLLLIALALGIARPVFWTVDDSSSVVLVLDLSESVAPAARAGLRNEARAWLLARPPEERLHLVQLGTEAPLELGPDASRLESLTRLEGSPLAEALELSATRIPVGARGAIVLASDGLAQRRDWASATQGLVARGIPVHVLELPGLAADPRIVGVALPDELRVGQSARLVVEVVGSLDTLGLVLVGPEGELARNEAGGLIREGRQRIALEFEPAEAGFLPVELQLEVLSGPDARAENNRLATTLAIQDPLRLLYLGDRIVGGAGEVQQLLGNGFELIDPSAGGDSVAPDFRDCDLVLLDDRPANLLPTALQERLVQAVVEQGVGLVAAGGQAAFGPGGYHEGPLASILPVESVQKEEKRDPSTTLVVIIDTSGSMGGNRVQLAKEVARLAINRLLPHDKVGLVEFYGAKRWAAPIQSAANRIELQRAINRLDAGGGTVILPAIEEAFYGLQNVQTRYKHVMVLTDGGVERGAFEPLIRKMASKGITVSTVLIGPESHSEFLVNIANWGKGRFYNVPNRFNLPEVILKQPTSSKLPAYRLGIHALSGRGGPAWWGAVDPTSVPAIEGYVETRARRGAQVMLETTQGGHPVLASWRYGLGRVTALTTEPTGPGTEGWKEWSGFGPLLARVLTRTAGPEREPYDYRLDRRGSELHLGARVKRTTGALPRAERLAGDGSLAVDFDRRADGDFSARLLADPAQEVRLLAGDAGAPRRLVSPAFEDRSGELQVDPAGALDLSKLGAATGGLEVSPGKLSDFSPLVGGAEDPPDLMQLAPWLLLLALLLYLLDIIHRRRSRSAAGGQP